MNYPIFVCDWHEQHHELSRIRRQVFIQEQAVPEHDEWDGLDQQATHFLVLDSEGVACGCARLLSEHTDTTEAQFHIGRVALLKPFRDKGIGTELMSFILHYCATKAPQNPVYLHAQCERQSFYQRLGFYPKGEVFMDAGIAHIHMQLNKEAING